MEIRNIAIIAHVDHGKTAITDALMRQTGAATDESSMDSNALEKERGITIYAKNASMFYKGTKINIIDTPGHADFGSEVERVLRSIDSVLLVVDAQEGPMPQTKFVLKKSLEIGLKPLVILNKIDKPAIRPEEVVEEVLELFMNLGASDAQLNFQTVYTIGKNGIAKKELTQDSKDMTPLLDAIIANVAPAPAEADKPLRMQSFNLDYDNYLGRLAIVRIYEGTAKEKDRLFIKRVDGTTRKGMVTKLFTFEGFVKKEVQRAEAGDIAVVAGFPEVNIGDTMTTDESAELLPHIAVDEPTISLGFMVNNSPFSGREGKFVTNSQLRERLKRELEINVGIKIDFSQSDQYTVYGRGEMHIAILLENMRREGYEVQVSQPRVILKEENGQTLEPFEELIIDAPKSLAGAIIEKIAKRKGTLTEIKTRQAETRLVFEIPTRGLLGFCLEFITDTRGEGIMASRVIGFRPHAGEIKRRQVGSMISMITGKALGFALYNLQNRGALYISPNIEVYEGMVVGNVSKGADMTVNPTRGKHLTNMRASGSDEALYLTPPLKLTLERGLEIMADDELLEITPKSIRLRKKILKR
ncbi:MAG: GTP-binding protein TypA [Parcubacteria group bacterium CG1_02_44_65]|uniref:50S ribosomal subunit assembly factor BipA n=3 Tax=Candidatus Portnoyibacteriota TaxID=1817913 RepID=A0A2M7YL50_9BACT|nr:MAG: GTP-binding protein TypA [Parcubacteria group bacterium CG1_02_44_65]PIP15421.1 MAG: translational GTPase TypA [Candidatus Portnoybacteria bacterium CG23_combo_of_CG06-09_8_20_14_all_44_36]PIZ69400.1 MAG: translational GTPase TypA [Candidatus Portnoybacteria bacterium CG_4_10_14_0_2_um_filter_43_36]PJA63691.1 MAG: translational GTPase TypA [Candidatus Portnoybacteria bacterium CG_4_9_14_3_um_filter_43_11]PJE59433.1 MAG: translational GTPase TypA [Candidatus Portnoybacteria bacterium CG1